MSPWTGESGAWPRRRIGSHVGGATKDKLSRALSPSHPRPKDSCESFVREKGVSAPDELTRRCRGVGNLACRIAKPYTLQCS